MIDAGDCRVTCLARTESVSAYRLECEALVRPIIAKHTPPSRLVDAIEQVSHDPAAVPPQRAVGLPAHAARLLWHKALQD
jgi:hypothetical protein